MAVVALAGGASVAHAMLTHSQAGTTRAAAPSATTIRNTAAAWVAAQVSRANVISCDPLMCRTLQAHGWPAGDLLQLRAGKISRLHSALVVVTPALTARLSHQAARHAPEVIASFGRPGGQIQLRAVARGLAAYRAQLSADELQRKQYGADLLGNPRFTIAKAAQGQLGRGQVDSRVLYILTAIGALRPTEILSFSGADPGARLNVCPLRTVELVQTPSANRAATARFAASMLSTLRAQDVSGFTPASMQRVPLKDGRTAVRVTFAAPGDFGVLNRKDPAGKSGG